MRVVAVCRRFALCLALGASGAAFAQAAPMKFQFDVVSIKPHVGVDFSTSIRVGPDSYTATGVGLRGLIQNAFGVDFMDEVTGLPPGLKDARYDIKGKLDAETAAAMKGLDREHRREAQRQLMRSMLEDRFHIKAHDITKEGPVYAMVVAPGGLKAKASPPLPKDVENAPRPAGTPVPGRGWVRISNGTMTCNGIEMANLAASIQGQVERRVIDKTGISGMYDFELKWSNADGTGSEGAPSIFTALQEQLGLRLESTRGPLNVIVVDHIEPPTED